MDLIQSIDDWNLKVEQTEKTVIVQTSAKWCRPCENMKSTIEEMVREHSDDVTWVSLINFIKLL